MRILITGGAGFIGSHVGDELLRHGHQVRVLDVLAPQVHGHAAVRPAYLHSDIELVRGDVRDRAAVRHALEGVDAVYHFAAAVGVGQSMYELEHYTSVNNVGTAVLLEALIEQPVRRLVVASSMSVYGEGLYVDGRGQRVSIVNRTPDQLRRGEWEPRDEEGTVLEPMPTPEEKTPQLASVYALSKWDQENLCLITGSVYGIPTIALRFFNVFGTRQALSNPYTGVLAIFASRLMNGKPPLVFEDGRQLRDFVSVSDVARACRLALDADAAVGHAINVGSGRAFAIEDIAVLLATVLGSPLQPEISGRYRVGDIRHCVADITRAGRLLGYTPEIMLEEGIFEIAEWLEGQAAHDRVDEARAELTVRGLTV
jgi:dTDP-L-rhamnose 4-epimerase